MLQISVANIVPLYKKYKKTSIFLYKIVRRKLKEVSLQHIILMIL